jgi:hypothetical protein
MKSAMLHYSVQISDAALLTDRCGLPVVLESTDMRHLNDGDTF